MLPNYNLIVPRIWDFCKRSNVPTANDIRYHLEKINDFESLEAQVNQALKSKIPSTIKKACLKIAIDLNLIPYYGKPSQTELPYVYRSEAKSGEHPNLAKIK